MRRKFITRLFYALLVCQSSLGFYAQSAVINDLYEAKIAVEDQSLSKQKIAIRQALREVLVKVRGNKDILDSPQIIKNISQASSYLRSYRYDEIERNLYIQLSFDAQSVEKMIRLAGFPVWDKRRPDTIVWLAVEDSVGFERRIVTADTDSALLEILSEGAKKRGIELIQPLWDLDDRQTLDLYDIWGGFTQQVIEASRRYGADAVLSARIYRGILDSVEEHVPNTMTDEDSVVLWLADWQLSNDEQLFSGQLSAEQQPRLVAKIVDLLADQLSAKYAIDLSTRDPNSSNVELRIINLNSLETYVRVSKFLNSLSVVERASLMVQQGEEATFQLKLLGDKNDLINALALDSKVQPVLDEFAQPGEELEYVWQAQ
jgi:hypothetical protein